MRFLLRFLATAASLWAAVALVPGVEFQGSWLGFLGVAAVFGLVNAVIRPILAVLTCPLVLLTLGLFLFVLNALMLWLTSAVSTTLGIGFFVDGFLAAFLGALVVTVVSTVLNVFLPDEPKERR